MTEKPAYAPGCFGSALSFASDDICNACVFVVQCEPVHRRALEQLRALYGVKAPTRNRKALPVKVQKVLDESGKTKEEIRDAMQGGQNPYRVADGTLGIVCHLILTAGVITRSRISEALGTYRKLNSDTANVYTRYALQILSHCGAVIIEGENVKLQRG